jgi:hypothetical protein
LFLVSATAAQAPHQFRTRNDVTKTQQMRSNRNENAVKSTKSIDILPLITVWLQVRVLPGPPAFAREANKSCRAEATAKAGRSAREVRLGKPCSAHVAHRTR